MLSVLVSLLVTVPMCYAPAAFVTFLVRERACKSKRVRRGDKPSQTRSRRKKRQERVRN